MSHYIYKKKAFIEIPDGRIMPLCLYADSSITDKRFDRYGRGHYFHPKSWFINTFSSNYGVLIDKQEFNKLVKESYESEMNALMEFRDKYSPTEEEPNDESYSYYGTIYPGGRKMKHMRYFYSTKHTIPAKEFLSKNTFYIRISVFNPTNFETIESKSFMIKTVDDIIYAEEYFEILKAKNIGRMCLGVRGLDGEDS